MEPNIDELKALMATAASAHTSIERRALELAICAIEVLRDTGTICSDDLFRIAEYLGFDAAAMEAAWSARTDYDLEKTQYTLGAPIARVLRLS